MAHFLRVLNLLLNKLQDSMKCLVTKTLLKGAFPYFFRFGKVKWIDNLLTDYQINSTEF